MEGKTLFLIRNREYPMFEKVAYNEDIFLYSDVGERNGLLLRTQISDVQQNLCRVVDEAASYGVVLHPFQRKLL